MKRQSGRLTKSWSQDVLCWCKLGLLLFILSSSIWERVHPTLSIASLWDKEADLVLNVEGQDSSDSASFKTAALAHKVMGTYQLFSYYTQVQFARKDAYVPPCPQRPITFSWGWRKSFLSARKSQSLYILYYVSLQVLAQLSHLAMSARSCLHIQFQYNTAITPVVHIKGLNASQCTVLTPFSLACSINT